MSKDSISETFNVLMPFALASTMTEIFKKHEQQRKLADHMNAVFLLAMLPVADGMLRALVGPEPEKGESKPLQDWHWQVYRREIMGEFDWITWLDRLNRICYEAIEQEIIRRLVREGE